MKHRFHAVKFAVSAAAVLVLGAAVAADRAAEQPAAKAPVVVCPLKPDPPPVPDGDRREWDTLPGALAVGDQNVTWGRAQYAGAEDLSGTVMLCYDANYLYLMAEVVDDKIVTAGGKGMFTADHVELTFAPHWRPGAKGPMPEDWRIIGFSPGSVEASGDPLSDLEPEAFLIAPPGIDWSGIDVGATMTEDGYILEARIPWRVLGVKLPVKPGMSFGVDVHLSDSDKGHVQESMTSLNPVPWQGRRQENILKMVLTGTDGKL